MSVEQFPLEEEYKKNTGIERGDVERFREWLNKQPHLPGQHITDLDIILAYHSCNRSSEIAKKVLDLNFTLRTLFTNIFKDRAFDEKIDHALETILFKLLPTRAKDGSGTVYFYFTDTNPKNLILVDVLKVVLMCADLWQYETGTWPGLLIIVDMAGMRLGHLACFDFSLLQQFFYFLQQAMFVKIKGIHLVNAPAFLDRVMSLMNSVSRVQDAFTVHTSYDTLQEYYPLEGLPSDVGGNYKSIQECKDEVRAQIKANSKYFNRESLKRVTESLRPGKPRTVTDFFGGIEGSFKQLHID